MQSLAARLFPHTHSSLREWGWGWGGGGRRVQLAHSDAHVATRQRGGGAPVTDQNIWLIHSGLFSLSPPPPLVPLDRVWDSHTRTCVEQALKVGEHAGRVHVSAHVGTFSPFWFARRSGDLWCVKSVKSAFFGDKVRGVSSQVNTMHLVVWPVGKHTFCGFRRSRLGFSVVIQQQQHLQPTPCVILLPFACHVTPSAVMFPHEFFSLRVEEQCEVT